MLLKNLLYLEESDIDIQVIGEVRKARKVGEVGFSAPLP